MGNLGGLRYGAAGAGTKFSHDSASGLCIKDVGKNPPTKFIALSSYIGRERGILTLGGFLRFVFFGSWLGGFEYV